MRKDDPELEPGMSPEVAEEAGRTPIGAIWTGLLGALMIGTVLALFSVSAWLVGPYLLLMAWLLGVPAWGRIHTWIRDREPASEAGSPRPDTAGFQAPQSEPPPPVEPEQSAAAPLEQEAPPPTPRPRKGRGRARKPAKESAPPPEPVAVSWVKVGPGQFVRVEATHASVDDGAGSHDPIPAEAQASPSAEAVPTGSPTRKPDSPDPDPEPDGPTSDSMELPAGTDEGAAAPEPTGEATEASSLQALVPAPEEAPSTPQEEGPPSPEVSNEPTLPVEELDLEGESWTIPARGPETVEVPAEVAPPELVVPDELEFHADVVLRTSQSEPANESEVVDEPRDESESDDEANHEEKEEALASPEVGEGDLPQAGSSEDETAGPAGELPDGPASGSEDGPEFDGESRLSFPPQASLSPTPARVPRWPVWLPLARWRQNRRNFRGPRPAASRPSRVRVVPRQAQGPRRHRPWHGVLRFKPRAPPDSILRRPPGVRRVVHTPHPPGSIPPEAGQAA